jgi:hypothetical protein
MKKYRNIMQEESTIQRCGSRLIQIGNTTHDPAERGRRIWLWWRIRVYEVQEFEYIPVALRLVALVPPSSCGIERVFSQLKLVLDSCGDNVLESTIESRLFERCSSTGFPLEVHQL